MSTNPTHALICGALWHLEQWSNWPRHENWPGVLDIYEAAADGSVSGSQMNVWKYSSSSVPPFTNYSTGWNACTLNARRYDTNPPDSIGVALIYRYDFVTPLGGILRFFGGTAISSLGISDKAVMALNPHN